MTEEKRTGTAPEKGKNEEAVLEEVREKIKEAEMVLVGIGEGLSPQIPQGLLKEDSLDAYRLSRYYEEIPADHEIILAYNRLRALIGAKPYFVVTLNTDDLIYRSDLEDDLIVAPCGSMAKMQCGEHILPAKDIRERVLAAGDAPQPECLSAGDMERPAAGEVEPEECPSAGNVEQALCPECGKPLKFHTTAAEDYMEEGYLPQWERYTKWLSCTLNRKLCILDLGTGFRYPQVIRWPFEKVAMYNQKAFLIRADSAFWQLPEELAAKGTAIAAAPAELLRQL